MAKSKQNKNTSTLNRQRGRHIWMMMILCYRRMLSSAVNLTTMMLNSIASQIRIQTIFEVELQACRRRIQLLLNEWQDLVQLWGLCQARCLCMLGFERCWLWVDQHSCIVIAGQGGVLNDFTLPPQLLLNFYSLASFAPAKWLTAVAMLAQDLRRAATLVKYCQHVLTLVISGLHRGSKQLHRWRNCELRDWI